jgi:aspartate/methionine/tyrosine aminotransferase
MFPISEMIGKIKGSERSQLTISSSPNAIRLNRGEPDFPTPAYIQEAAYRAMKNNFTHYGSSYGDDELREAICFSLKRDYGVERKPGNILITAGGIAGINTVVATYVNPGDEVLIPDPGYSAYGEAVNLFGGKTVYFPLSDTFHFDFQRLEKRISRKSKMIFLANPSNPTGVVWTEEELRSLGRIALDHNLLLIVDEVYHKLLYGGVKHFSICQIDALRERTILLNSFSKTYAMTGWRVGYLLAEKGMVEDLELFHKTMLFCVNTVAQKACVAALTGPQDCVEEMVAEYDRRRKFVYGALKGIRKISVFPCEGAFYFFPRFEHKFTSREMMNYLAQKQILVRSGTEFGGKGEKHIRISFTTPMDSLKEGMERLKEALNELG